MVKKTVQGTLHIDDNFHAEIRFELGGITIPLQFSVECPNQKEHNDFHLIEKNGHAVKTKAKSQQFHCRTCGRYFYAQTSRFFTQFNAQIKSKIENHLMDGNLKNLDLAKLCNWSVSSAGRILDKIFTLIEAKAPEYKEKRGKLTVKIVFMDETFLKIQKKTWYLIMAISDTGQILAAELKEHRDQATIIRMMHGIEAQMNTPIKIFATDGLTAYKGVALALHHDLIHIRHIHSPPYGRIEIDAIKLLSTPGQVEITSIATMNDIFKEGGVFLARVRKKTISVLNPPPKKRGRKRGGKNRSKQEIQAEKRQKRLHPKKRGRPKKKLTNPVHIFKIERETGSIQPWGEGSQDAANILTSVYHAFGKKCITTNLIEKEFSALKILICFRGRRSVARWKRLLMGYCGIRNNPFILASILDDVSLSGTAIRNALIHQISMEVEC
jgi:transposase-like protein